MAFTRKSPLWTSNLEFFVMDSSKLTRDQHAKLSFSIDAIITSEPQHNNNHCSKENVTSLKQVWKTTSESALKGHSSQVFHLWPKCWKKPKTYCHQIWTSFVLPFSRYSSSKLAIFSYFSVVILPVLWQKINFWKIGSFYLKNTSCAILIFYFVLTTTLP